MNNKKENKDEDHTAGNVINPDEILQGLPLIVVSNRGPVDFFEDEDGKLQMQRNTGGLVTALLGLSQNINITWVASALTDLEKNWGSGSVLLEEDGCAIDLHLVPIEEELYDGYYNTISNPLLWFLQHSMWNFFTNPIITRSTWNAWHEGYVGVNMLFAKTVAKLIKKSPGRPLVMIQDYHLYLLPRMLRNLLHRTRSSHKMTLSHFVHIPWPVAEELRILPPEMRKSILDGLCAVDILGFQTKSDKTNFLQSIATHIPDASVNYRKGTVRIRKHTTIVRDYPISIDVAALKNQAEQPETIEHKEFFENTTEDQQLIVRVDRTDPSKNIVRGFQALGELLELYPEHIGKVTFIALLVPSRLEVDEYHDYHDKLMAAAGWVNSKYGTGDWEPIRIILGDNYSRAIAGLQLYDVLLVNSIADGMNLVAKEGPIVNQKNGMLVLSESTGASQQLHHGAMIIPPCDIYATAEALHKALTMPIEERKKYADLLRHQVEENDVNTWFWWQIEDFIKLGYIS